ncbi:queuosine precursor transporter [Vibrio parahaemolyticus]|uniref:queuosine precursor transporter n=1 Tax=Vibrio parahaemolyticus TaxID=670 RepID=UPI0011235DC2|nr:queuosine precursor transporter [Vibrio parahaemolyticus]MDF4270081.1 queuosine precursor transporter [Vibrio parahaemolyticus]MDF4275451.1 queuosine precursor transporter [Vibrio parahaemolyticus]MDF4300016.1 queuosine precursor transporter [Vibrio parahaemolyticus]TOH11470.1 precorrin-3B C(17)-methyltransferase [Vibrio parahaemolyticus]
MKLIIYKIDDGFVEYLDDKGKEFRSSLAFIIESQMIEYFDNDDRLKLCELYKDKYNSELVVETALWGGMSIYKVSNMSYLSILRCLFYMCMIISVLLAPREVSLWGMNQPGGILFFCLSFLFIDTICQSYGYYSARKTLWANALLMFCSGGLIYISSLLPAIADDVAYQKVVFDGMVKLCFINGICSLIADQVNALVFRRIKYITNNKSLWLRSILSTLVSQFFFTILWISFFKIENIFNINTYIFIFSNFQIKILFSIILIPFLYFLTLSLNRKIKF